MFYFLNKIVKSCSNHKNTYNIRHSYFKFDTAETAKYARRETWKSIAFVYRVKSERKTEVLIMLMKVA